MASRGPDGANLAEMAARSPVGDTRGWLYNPELDEQNQYMDFHFRPEPVREQLQANYEKMAVIGMSHQYQSYSYTNNMQIGFELYMNRLMLLKQGAISSNRSARQNSEPGTVEGTRSNLEGASREMEWSRRYLEALLVPPVNYTGLVASAPPAVILSLPGVITMRCRLMVLSIEFMAVDIQGNLTELKAKVRFEEAPLNRIT